MSRKVNHVADLPEVRNTLAAPASFHLVPCSRLFLPSACTVGNHHNQQHHSQERGKP